MKTESTPKPPIRYKSATPRVRLRMLKPADLQPHPLLRRVGLLPDMISREETKGNKAGKNRETHKELAAEMTEEFEALRQSILAQGVMDPLKIVRDGDQWLIADGRNRWEASRSIDPEKPIPCVEVGPEEVREVILAAGTRRHMSKQARALMAVMVYPEIAEDAKAGRPKKSPDEQGISQVALAKLVGVGLATVEEACRFWRAISLTPKTRDERLNQVFSGVSFERIEQGDSSAKASGGKERPPSQPALLLLRNANSMIKQWSSWQEISPEARVKTTEKMVEAMRGAPAEMREAIQAAWEGGEA